MDPFITGENLDNAQPDYGFVTTFPNSKLVMIDSINKDKDSFVRFKFAPINGERVPFNGIIPTNKIVTDPNWAKFFDKKNGNYVPKANIACVGTKDGLEFSLS